jgi:hypothetical protein
MGREIKRVALDFDWPRDKVWQGYLTPESLHEAPCPAGSQCVSGVTPARAWVAEIAHLALMLDDDLRDQQRERPMHPYFDSIPKPWATGEDLFSVMSGRATPAPRPSSDIVEFGAGLAGREASGFMGHDGIDQWRATDKLLAAAGLDPEVWGICLECGGHASVEAYPGQRADREAWEPTEPPTGDGWQLWETVSEGSPISPVFADAEGLARWLTTSDSCRGAQNRPMTIEQARGFVGVGWAPSLIGDADGLHDGATYVGTDEARGGES